MFKVNFYLCCYLALGYLVSTITADCSITSEGGKPIFTKKFGRKTLTLRREQTSLILKPGEIVNAFCSKGLRLYNNGGENFIRNTQGISSILLKCSNEVGYEYLYYKYEFEMESSMWKNRINTNYVIKISCDEGSQGLYEINQTLPSCGLYSSYGIGAVTTNSHQTVTAAICFDFETLSTKYIKSFIYPTQYNLLDDLEINQVNSNGTILLDTPVENFKNLLPFPSDQNLKDGLNILRDRNPLLAFHEFELQSLVQDNALKDDVKNFDYLLNTVWWRNLRLGSWKFFLTALKTRSQKVKYISYTGMSGTLNISSTSNCKENNKFQINMPEGAIIIAPETIWMYLKPIIPDKNDEFVVVGYNTPFYSSNTTTAICKNICSEIDWLQKENFSKIHLLPSFGIVHCCRPEEVADKFTAFPIEEVYKDKTTTEASDKI